jgi:hypothetical protein
MTCKHCNENVVPNTVKRSPAPFVYHPWKHDVTHFIHCWDTDRKVLLGCVAEPKESV